MVQLRGVSKRYSLGNTEVSALKKIDLSVKKGSFISIIGPSGSGKSTLLNLIACLDIPTDGEVVVDGQVVNRLSGRQLADLRLHRIGIVFQSFNLIPVLNVYENVEYPLLLQGVARPEKKRRIEHLLEAVGLADRHFHKPDELSGGQRQRVGVARALVTHPALVIADEPTGNLDSQTALSIIALMRRLNREEGTTFIFSTHDSHIIESVDVVIRLQDGQICS